MNRLGLIFAVWIFLGLDLGLSRSVFAWGASGVAPCFLFVLVAFVAMGAQPRTANWTALAIGLLVDLTSPIPLSTHLGRGFVIGPHAAGFLAAVQLILALRGVMIRHNPLTLGFLTACGLALSEIVFVAILWVRSSFDPMSLSPSHDLLTGLGSALYTGVLAVPLALALLPLAEFLGLPNPHQRRFARP